MSGGSKRTQETTAIVRAVGELHLEGNIIPHSFFTRPEFKSDRGITQHVAIMIYADDLYWYRPTHHRDELTGKLLRTTRKFDADKLQRSYEYYAGLFGITKQQATDSVKFLVDRGLTTREFRTVRAGDGRRLSNVMFVEPVIGALKALLNPYEGDGTCWAWVSEPPKPNQRKEKQGGIPNKPDTYPEHSGYLSDLSRRRIPSIPDTNTETSQETSSETSQRGGVSHVIENAREETPAPAASVAEQSPLPHTTLEASLSKDFGAMSEPGPVVAVLPPDGGTADAAITDSELEFLFGTAEGPQETEQAESGEKIPGGAAAPLAPPTARADVLRAVDREELLERAVAMPSDTAYRLVKGLVGGNKAIDDGILDTLTPAGALSRRDWLRLTETELTEVRRVAQAEAQAEKLNFYTCAIRGLDVLIGAPVGQTGQRGKPGNAVVANAGCHAPAQHFEDADRSADMGKFDIGASWLRKADQEAVTIARTELVKRRGTEGLVFHLSDGKPCSALQLMTGYEFQGAETKA